MCVSVKESLYVSKSIFMHECVCAHVGMGKEAILSCSSYQVSTSLPSREVGHSPIYTLPPTGRWRAWLCLHSGLQEVWS